MKKTLAIVLILCCALTVFASSGKEKAVQDEYWTIGTAGTTGALYPMGVAMAQTISDHISNYFVTGEATAASIANIKGLQDGSYRMAISQTEVASLAYNGLDIYAGSAQVKGLRSMFSTIYNYLQVFTLEGKGINKIEDLKGKVISLGASGSGGQVMAKLLLECYGFKEGVDYTAQYMNEADGVSAIKDGKIDALIATNPLAAAALTELTTSAKAKMLDVNNDKFYELVPAYTKYKVPAGTYQGIDYEVTTPKARIIMICLEDSFTEEEAYNVCKAIWENRDEWASSAKSVQRDVVLETALEEIDIPLHPGALKYFKEIGLTIPDKLK